MIIANLSCRQPQSTQNGTATNGAWRTYPINTIDSDPFGICSLSSNQITLAAGTYNVRAVAVFNITGATQIRLFNVTDNAVISQSEGIVNIVSGVSQDTAETTVQFTLTAAKAIRVEYQVTNTVPNSGLGYPANWGVEVYASVSIQKG